MEKDKISVIIPIYKVEKYLPKCLDSIINQTYKNLEIILVDDGSPDNCGKICDEYAEMDSRIKVIHKENGGVSSARNAGIDENTGVYTVFVDGDDYVKENMLEHMVELIKRYEADVVQVEHCSDEKEFFEKNTVSNVKVIRGRKNIREFVKQRAFHVMGWGKLYRSELIKNVRFLEGLKFAEDNEFGYRLYKNVKKAVCSNEKMYFYFLQNTESVTYHIKEGYLPWITWCEIYSQAVEREKACRWLKNLFYSHLIRSIIFYYMEAAKRGDFELCSRLRAEAVKKGGINIFRMDFPCKVKYLIFRCCKTPEAYLRIYDDYRRIKKMIR